MSELSDEPCVGAAGGSQNPSPSWVTGVTPAARDVPFSQKVGLRELLTLHRHLGECRKGCCSSGDIFVGFSVDVQPQGGRDTRQSIS